MLRIRALRAKSVLAIRGQIVLEYTWVRIASTGPKMRYFRRSQQRASCNLRARPISVMEAEPLRNLWVK